MYAIALDHDRNGNHVHLAAWITYNGQNSRIRVPAGAEVVRRAGAAGGVRAPVPPGRMAHSSGLAGPMAHSFTMPASWCRGRAGQRARARATCAEASP